MGGNFVYPPATLDRQQCEKVDRVVFVAGGVGINPIMSMISAMHEAGTRISPGGMVSTVRILYTSRRVRNAASGKDEEILFEKRLKNIADKWNSHEQVDYKYTLFETSDRDAAATNKQDDAAANFSVRHRRITHDDLLDALGPQDSRGNTLVYVCGLPTMTDEFVALLQKTPGMDRSRVLCEKWW